METEELLEKIAKDLETNQNLNPEHLQKQNCLSEILQNFSLIPKNELPKPKIQDTIRDLETLLDPKTSEMKENQEETQAENKDFNKENNELNIKENKKEFNNKESKQNNNKELNKKSKLKKTADDTEYEEMTEYVKNLEKYMLYQEEFCK